MLICTLAAIATPAYSAKAVQIFECSRDEAATDVQLEDAAQAWLKAAKQMKGGKNLKAYLQFPIVAQTGEVDVRFVVVAPSIPEWGVFWGDYDDSPTDKLDAKNTGLVDCPSNSLWEAEQVQSE